MTPLTLLAAYSLALAAASMLGGMLPNILRLTHTRTQTIMSLVAGLMLGVALFHLLPHGIQKLSITMSPGEAVDQAALWMMAGLLLMFILLRLFHFHHHDFTKEGLDHGHHDHDTGDHCSGHSPNPASVNWAGIFIGMSVHTIIDGVALGAALLADTHNSLLGMGVFLAILLHKPLDSLAITAVMANAGWSTRLQMLVNIVFALLCPLGAMMFLIGIDFASAHSALVIGLAMAFSAGVFLCISLSDLLPEIQFHSHDSFRLTIALAVGVLLALGIGLLEPQYHVH